MTVSEIAAVPAFGRFFLPGPTEVRPEILAAQLAPMIGHRGKAMETFIAEMQPGLRPIFRTSRPVYISASSATGLMEAAIRNCAGRRVLSLVNGAFSERFYRIALAHGVEAVALEVPLGAAHTPEKVERRWGNSRLMPSPSCIPRLRPECSIRFGSWPRSSTGAGAAAPRGQRHRRRRRSGRV